MLDKLESLLEKFQTIEKSLADPATVTNQSQYQKLAKEYSELTPVVEIYRQYLELVKQQSVLEDDLKSVQDAEYLELAQQEMTDLKERSESLLVELKERLNPKKKQADRDLIMEIRAGTGGQEASLFAGDLYRMYTKYADSKGWTVDSISSSESETGGYKEIIFSISGTEASQRLQWESGAHRVQRVPVTEASGRIHTSAATVAVLFEPEEVEVQIDPKDIKIDVFRSSGPGGQSVNTTDSAIRLTHLPTGLVVICQDERSQLKNKHKAMRVLRARLHDLRLQENLSKTTQDRKLKVGSGDRSEKIRTYNFPDRRITDHRIGFTTHRLNNVLDGEMDEITDALIEAAQNQETDTA